MDAASRLAGRALGETPLLADVSELCDEIGGRPTGSPACQRAIDWGVAKFRAIGIPVATESFSLPSLWLGGTAEAAALAPEAFALRVVAFPQTASTPGGEAIEARLVDAGDGTRQTRERGALGARHGVGAAGDRGAVGASAGRSRSASRTSSTIRRNARAVAFTSCLARPASMAATKFTGSADLLSSQITRAALKPK